MLSQVLCVNNWGCTFVVNILGTGFIISMAQVVCKHLGRMKQKTQIKRSYKCEISTNLQTFNGISFLSVPNICRNSTRKGKESFMHGLFLKIDSVDIQFLYWHAVMSRTRKMFNKVTNLCSALFV